MCGGNEWGRWGMWESKNKSNPFFLAWCVTILLLELNGSEKERTNGLSFLTLWENRFDAI